MLSIALMPICGLILYVVIGLGGDSRKRIQTMLVGAFILRMVLQYVVRNVPVFSGGIAGGDAQLYDLLGQYISHIWDSRGIHFVTNDELWGVGTAALPINLFAFVIHLNGGQAQEGCTAIVAMATCLSGYNFYKLALELGAEQKVAYWLTTMLMFSPALLMYSSDAYKDGMVLMFQFGATASAVRLSRRFTVTHFILGILCLFALWYVRAYLVFASLAPLAVGLVGLNSKSVVRPLLFLGALSVFFLVLAFTTDALNAFSDKATEAFAVGTSARVRDYAAQGGSGVIFEDEGNIYGDMHLKLIYTLFAPFPWQTGSIGLHIGKIDAAISSYMIYRSLKTCRSHWDEHKTTIVMLLSFALPMALAYAVGISNVGLVLRQRIPIVVVFTLIASLGFRSKAGDQASEVAPIPEEIPKRGARYALRRMSKPTTALR